MPAKKASRHSASRRQASGGGDELIAIAIALFAAMVGPIAKPHLDRWLRQLDPFFLGESDSSSSEHSYKGHARSENAQEIAEQDWFEVLGVEEGATKAEARAAHRSKIKQFHPDKVAHMAKIFVDLANQETQKLNIALEEALRRKS